MSLGAIGGTAKTLTYYLRLQETLADNIANATTDGFKSMRMTAHIPPEGENAVPVQWTDWTQGALRETGRTLDVAIDGPGFFVLQTESGERLTRGGSLKLDGAARLTDMNGNPLLSKTGPVFVHGADVEVQANGTVIVDGAVAGELRVEIPDDPGQMRREEEGRFVANGPTRRVPEETTVIRQGRIEDANLDPVASLVELVSIERAYSANAQALKALDAALGTATNDVGNVSR